VRTRETCTNIKDKEIKKNTKKSPIKVLARDTYKFKEKLSNNQVKECTYDVELILLKDLKGNNSLCNSEEYKIFYEEEINNLQNKKYDLDMNIRDLYPINIHTENKRKIDVDRFNILNELILSLNEGINRRVVKKEIVYKKNKSKSIIAIKLFNDYLNVYFSDLVENVDLNKKVCILSQSNRKPLDRFFVVKNDNDIEYLSKIIKEYVELLFIK